MKYKPYWERIFFLSVLMHFIFFCLIGFSNISPFSAKKEISKVDELEWIEVEVDEDFKISEVEIPKATEIFSEIKFPPIKIPQTPKIVHEKIISPEIPQTKSKIAEDTQNNLIALRKVFPKDVAETLIFSGIIKERPVLKEGKIILSITVDLKGKAKDIKILHGEDNFINLVSEAAASGWTFEPYKDENGEIKEMKTQIEFYPEDF